MFAPIAIFKLRSLLVAVATAGLVVGIVAWLAGKEGWSTWAWIAGTVPVLAALIAEIITSLRRGDVGLDIVAALSMSAALAFGEPLAGNVVALMYAGGQFLESYAEGRARREMTALLGRVAHTAMRYAARGLEEVPIEALAAGDRILVRHGEVIPVDGDLSSDGALVDESAMTGEGVPVEKRAGEEVPSGATNVGNAFDLTVARPAAESTYANIVRLVRQAQESKAPSVRIADRFAIWFLLLTLVIAGAAWWISGDRVRALAVLVVATPCPLILALPVAIISGMSRAAKSGVLVKSGGALEMLAKIRTAILDKTGTLTFGQATISDIKTSGKWNADEVLRLAASLDQASNHVVAEALIAAAQQRGLKLSLPTEVSEDAGAGIVGAVDGRRVVVGGSRFVRARSQKGDPYALREGVPEGTAVVAVSIDGEVAGLIVLADQVRPDAASLLDAFRRAGIDRLVLASGDRKEVVAAVARQLQIDDAFGELSPEDKVEIVRRECSRAPTMMLGDGVNDAPALASADVGVAMGARGSAASSETADVVLLVDLLQNLTKALDVAHRTRRIALESVFVGLGLSIVAMIVAAFGYLPPVAGALVQEAIDVAVILNALRALK
ncbi:heavy metal translocating P-type ATPase [Mesorhizobium sp. LHD-90]|uniref:heavy metal translocating P-type ATPase n=1 Tax=Mesorhizobium sp. LHD-90 TaxID=3071414 RepID=UPI0027E08779|nr:heavy metal translocating P-type ATPase [Mesorhizobium sp. LHD-90]MDQ6435614.1 heavy metal translocating P-type ATPase [Mesorhizobium sp. LHD-90]